jgi:hypothetical protein
MGWITTYRAPGKSNRDFFEQEVLGENYAILDCATIDRTFYAAVKHPEGYVFGLVVLIYLAPRAEFNFGWKDIDESMGPAEDHCPQRVLDLLTPIDTLYPWDRHGDEPSGRKWAREWRERCAANAAAKAQRPTVKPGDTLIFDHPLEFASGATHSELRLIKGSLFEVGCSRFRIPKWRERSYSVRPKADNCAKTEQLDLVGG